MSREPEFFYILFAREWPLRAAVPVSTSTPVAVGDVFDFEFRSDVADHRVRLEVMQIVHCQIGLTGGLDAGCQPQCRLVLHDAQPIGTREHLGLEPDKYVKFLPQPPRRRRPKLRVVR